MKIWLTLLALIGGTVSPCWVSANYIDSAGRQWREPQSTVGFSYNQVVADISNGCDPLSGACRGRLGGSGPSVEGWTWATEPEVRRLFGELGIPGFNASPSDALTHSENDSAWLPRIVSGATSAAGLFEPNFFDPFFIANRLGVGGLTRTTTSFFGETRDRAAVIWRDVFFVEELVYDPVLDVFFTVPVTRIIDSASTEFLEFLDFPSGGPGFGEVGGLWMYQSAAVVDAPGILSLLGLGWIVLSLAARRRADNDSNACSLACQLGPDQGRCLVSRE